MADTIPVVVDTVVADTQIGVDMQVVTDTIERAIIIPTPVLPPIDSTPLRYLITFIHPFSPRTLDDAIKEDKLLTMNQFQYVKQDAEEEYEEYVKRHQQVYLERFYQKHSKEAW